MQSPPASVLPRLAGSPPRALSHLSRGRARSAWRAHLAACVTAGVATFLLAYAAFQGVGAIFGWRPPPLFGTAAPVPLYWRCEAAGVMAIASMALVLPACRIDVDGTLRWMGRALGLAIAAVSVVALLFP